ncbi:uncharacterized protein LOC141505825 [Macrotis lagotis]|uniref:uncharacterized protein LOC141505825 n=1 Tax=Macrotis lagotis TaxID=92651 RepID=UPI003D69D6D4
MLTFLAPIDMQGSEHWVFIERECSQPEELVLRNLSALQPEDPSTIPSDDLCSKRVSKVDVRVDKFRVEVATEELVRMKGQGETCQRGRMIASPEDFESLWEDGVWAQEGPERTSLLASHALVEKISNTSQPRLSSKEETIGEHRTSANQLEGHVELRKELEEFHACRQSSVIEPEAQQEVLGMKSRDPHPESPALEKESMKVSPGDSTRADSSDETETSPAERSFYLSFADKEQEELASFVPKDGKVADLGAIQEDQKGHVELEDDESIVAPGFNSSDQVFSSLGGNTGMYSEGDEPPTIDVGLDELKVLLEQLSKKTSLSHQPTSNEKSYERKEEEFLNPIGGKCLEEEMLETGNSIEKVQKSPPKLENQSLSKGGENELPKSKSKASHLRKGPQRDINGSDRQKEVHFPFQERSLHALEGDPELNENKTSAVFLQMEGIIMKDSALASPGNSETMVSWEDCTNPPPPKQEQQANDGPSHLEHPIVFPKTFRFPKGSLGNKDTVVPDVAKTKELPTTNEKAKDGAKQTRVGGLVLTALEREPKQGISFQASGQEGSQEDISKTSVANKIKIFERGDTHGADNLWANVGDSRALPSEQSSEPFPGQVEQQRNKLLELGFVQLHPPNNISSSKATELTGSASDTGHFVAKPGTSADPNKAVLIVTELNQGSDEELTPSSVDSSSKTILAEAGVTSHMNPSLLQHLALLPTSLWKLTACFCASSWSMFLKFHLHHQEQRVLGHLSFFVFISITQANTVSSGPLVGLEMLLATVIGTIFLLWNRGGVVLSPSHNPSSS